MDQKPASRKSGTAVDRPSSAHVIDLRQNRPIQPSKAPVAAAPTSKPAPKKAVSAKPEPAKPAPKPAEKEDFFGQPANDSHVMEAPASQRRFWPSFFRFLLLLIVLGLIIAGGLYLYLTYYV